jgi:hypothetical protein
MATMHDLRVSVRDKMRTITELEMKIKELQAEIVRKDTQIYEFETKLKKRDDIINTKDLIIKEKELIISRLENSSRNGDNNNNIENLLPIRSLQRSITPSPVSNKLNNEHTVTLTLPVAKIIAKKPQTQLPAVISKTKRMAISAEPAQLNKKSKDFKTSLKEYEKTDETKEFLRNGILDNEFMKNLEMEQINSIVKCMYPIEYQKDSLIIVESDVGNLVYIIDGIFIIFFAHFLTNTKQNFIF